MTIAYQTCAYHFKDASILEISRIKASEIFATVGGMAVVVVKLKQVAIEMEAFTSVEVRPNLLSYIPRIMSLAVIAIAMYMIAMAFSTGIGIFDPPYGERHSIWDKVGFVILVLFLFGIGIGLAGSAIGLLVGKSTDESLTTLKWVLGAAIVFCIFGAGLNLHSADQFTYSHANINDRYKMVASFQEQAWLIVFAGAGFALAFCSLFLLDLKDVVLGGPTSTRKLKFIDGDEAETLKNSLSTKGD